MSKRALLFATLFVCSSALAATPADLFKGLDSPAIGTPAAVSNVVVSVGHMKLTLASGTAAKVTAAGDPVGLFFKGSGSFEYTAEATELPLVTRNVKSESKAKLNGAAIGDDVTEVMIWSAGEALPAIGEGGGAALADAFKAHSDLFERVRVTPATQVIAPVKFGLPGKTVVAEIVTPRDNLVYTFDSAEAQEEWLFATHPPRGGVIGEKKVQEWLFPAVLSAQPVDRSVKTWAKPPYTLTALDYSLVAEGDNAKLEVTETIAPRVGGQQALRFDLDNEIFAGSGKTWRQVNLRSVTDEQGHALSLKHEDGHLLVLLAAPAAQPFKLKFAIDGDFLVREGGDNAWQLANFNWYPQPSNWAARYFTVHSVVKMKKPFVPIVPGNTVSRKEEGDYTIVENVIDKPIDFPNVQGGKYNFVEETRGDLTVRVAAYGLRNERGSKTLIELAFGIIDYYEVFLGPFPWKEFNIVQVNTYGYGQAPAATMFITNEAFTPLASEEDQFFSQGINERFAHEIAHQYWGHVVKAPGPEEEWLRETFAEYSAALALKKLRSEAIYNRLAGTWRGKAKQAAGIAPIPYASRIGGDPMLAFVARANLLYNKGPVLLTAIDKKLGAEKFLIFMKSYQKSFAWKFGSTRDVAGLLGVLTKEDWMPFFDQYYWGLGLPQ